MKTRTLCVVMALALCLVAPTGSKAQSNEGLIYPGALFGSFNVGGALYAHDGANAFGVPSFGFSGGSWLVAPLAVQFSVDGIMAPNTAGESSIFLFGGVDFKWDVNSTFFHVYNKNYLSPVPFYPLIGLGLSACNLGDTATVDYAYHVMLGLQVPYRVSDKLDLYFQYKCFFLRQGFDNSAGDNYMHSFGIGLLYNQRRDPFHRNPLYVTRSITEDWFFGLGIGPNYSAFDLFTNPNLGGLSMVGIAPELMVGRNFSNLWSVRLELGGITAHEAYDTLHSTAGASYRFSHLHADLMLNVSRLINNQRGYTFNVMPYLGAGPVWRYDDLHFDVGADLGIFLRYYLGYTSDLYLDMKYLMVAPSIGGGRGPSGNFYGVGLPSITVGYIHNFGHSTTRYRQPINEVRSR